MFVFCFMLFSGSLVVPFLFLCFLLMSKYKILSPKKHEICLKNQKFNFPPPPPRIECFTHIWDPALALQSFPFCFLFCHYLIFVHIFLVFTSFLWFDPFVPQIIHIETHQTADSHSCFFEGVSFTNQRSRSVSCLSLIPRTC